MEQTDEKEPMTAEELIEELQKVDPESLVQMEVKIGDTSYWSHCYSVTPWERDAPGGFDFVVLEGD